MRLPVVILYLAVAAAIVTFGSCNRKIAGPAEPGISAPSGKLRLNQVLRAIDANRTTAEWMDAKARVDVKTDDLDIGGTAYLRLHRDEAIWMSVKKFGFEGARALIRPDSFFLYNRLEGEYLAEPLSYLEEKYKIPARFDLLQEIFFGNAAFLTDDLSVRRGEGGLIQLMGSSAEFSADYRYDPLTYRLSTMDLQEVGAERALTVSNADYREADGLSGSFPRRREIRVNGGSEGRASLDFDFTDLAFDRPVAMPFNYR